jgi:hypothetical protein
MDDLCENYNQSSGFVEGLRFLNRVSDCQIFKENCVLSSYLQNLTLCGFT